MRRVGGAKPLAEERAAKNGTDASKYTGPAEGRENGQREPLIFSLRDHPEWRRDPRAITFLKTYSPRKLATKQWIGDAVEAIDYDKVKWWTPFVALPNNLDELGAIVERAEGFPRIAAFRGAVRLASMPKDKITRIYRIDKDEEPDLEDAPLHWLMIDLDSRPEPTHFRWLDDPARAALWAVETYLPPAWAGVRFFYQYSSGAGIKPGLRLHFWYWLSNPISCADLKADFMRRYGNSFFDPSVFKPSQPNYTAAPIFINRPDPLEGRRCGFAGGGR